MYRKTALCLVASLTLAACQDDTPGPFPELAVNEAEALERSGEVAQRFQSELQAQLKDALESGGPMLAADVCHAAAPVIAARQAEESGAQVRRVADRNRNPEAGVSDDIRPHYDQLAAAPVVDGQPARTLWVSGTGAEAQVHVLSAIPMKDQPCSTCHGTNIDPELKARLTELYPGDKATGFTPGEMRGAMLVSWPATTFALGDER